MARVVGVLSPFLGGWYFGGVLEGIARTAADAGAAVVAMQTLDAGTDVTTAAATRRTDAQANADE